MANTFQYINICCVENPPTLVERWPGFVKLYFSYPADFRDKPFQLTFHVSNKRGVKSTVYKNIHGILQFHFYIFMRKLNQRNIFLSHSHTFSSLVFFSSSSFPLYRDKLVTPCQVSISSLLSSSGKSSVTIPRINAVS